MPGPCGRASSNLTVAGAAQARSALTRRSSASRLTVIARMRSRAPTRRFYAGFAKRVSMVELDTLAESDRLVRRPGFAAPVGVAREALTLVAVHRCAVGPGPAAELGAPIVGVGLLQLLLGVHDERAVLGDGLADRLALQHQKLAGCRAVDELDVGVGAQLDCGGLVDRLPADRDARALEKVEL